MVVLPANPFCYLQRRISTTIIPKTQVNANHTSFHEVTTLCKQSRSKNAVIALHNTANPVRFCTCISLLQACIKKKSLSEGKLVHAYIIKNDYTADMFTGNTLVNMYVKCGSVVDARRVFDQMNERDPCSWTVMIAAYARHGAPEEALVLFHQMRRTNVQPSDFTFSSILPACASLADLEQGMEIHEEIIRRGFESHICVANALVDMYAKCGNIATARHLFDKISQPDVVSWTAMIAGYAQNGLVHEAQNLFKEMPERNVVSWNAMIGGFAHNGFVVEALQHFQEMSKPNVVSWTLMIAAYTRHGYPQEALSMFRQMQKSSVQPNQFTYSSVLSACADLASLEQGVEIHEEIVRMGYQSHVSVKNALVDMYAKCGSIEKAREVFDKMYQRNVVSWTAMIAGYALHGYGMEALDLFEQMIESGVSPNDVTLVSVLTGCSHAGLVEKGFQYFNCMSTCYHITPAMEHYRCMVDLLGRAGRLDEAYDFVNKMPIKPDSVVWICLLGACRVYNNIELGECVAERVFEVDSENAVPYVLLSNIYAACGRWEKIEKVRDRMKDRGVKKTPGYSWIEVNKEVHAFLVGDRSHPQTPEIYKELERLYWEMKVAGYIPDTRFVLNDVKEEEKEQILWHHSEKLAIAFGLLNTSPGSTIRVIKNLRVCGDCHSATKFISNIVAREIVVRDANRYHHFKDGQCSCGDYW